DEIAGNVRSEVESHLQRCEECRRELRIQIALRTRLLAEERTAPPVAVVERLEAHLYSLGAGGSGYTEAPARSWSDRVAEVAPRVRPIVTWTGWLVAASLAALWIIGKPKPSGQSMAGMTMGPPIPV